MATNCQLASSLTVEAMESNPWKSVCFSCSSEKTPRSAEVGKTGDASDASEPLSEIWKRNLVQYFSGSSSGDPRGKFLKTGKSTDSPKIQSKQGQRCAIISDQYNNRFFDFQGLDSRKDAFGMAYPNGVNLKDGACTAKCFMCDVDAPGFDFTEHCASSQHQENLKMPELEIQKILMKNFKNTTRSAFVDRHGISMI